MPTTLDNILEDLLAHGLSVQDDIFSESFVAEILQNFDENMARGKFQDAGIGKGLLKKRIPSIRGDKICWIEDWESPPALKSFYDFSIGAMNSMRQNLFLPLKRIEAHYACYDPGAFYKKHKDQHRTSPHRQISMILYLSEWKEGFGGELLCYGLEGVARKVFPLRGRVVFFISGDVFHEVLVSNYQRKTLTSWFRDDAFEMWAR